MVEGGAPQTWHRRWRGDGGLTAKWAGQPLTGVSLDCTGRAERRRRFRAHHVVSRFGGIPSVRKRCRAALATAVQDLAELSQAALESATVSLKLPWILSIAKSI